MRDQSTYPFDIYILHLIQNKKYSWNFTSYFIFTVLVDMNQPIMCFVLFCKLLCVFLVKGK